MHQETTHKLMIFRNSLKNFNKRHSLSQPSESSSAFSVYESRSFAINQTDLINSTFRPINQHDEFYQ